MDPDMLEPSAENIYWMRSTWITWDTFGISTPLAAASVQTKIPPFSLKSAKIFDRSSKLRSLWYRKHSLPAPCNILATASTVSTVFANTMVRMAPPSEFLSWDLDWFTALMSSSTWLSRVTSTHLCSNLK